KSADESEIFAGLRAALEEIFGEPVVDRSLPVQPRQRIALAIGDRDDGSIGKFAIERHIFRKIQAAGKVRDVRRREPPRDGIMHVRQMEVYEIELGGAPRDFFDQQNVVEGVVFFFLVQTKRLVANRSEAGGRPRVAARKQGHLMALADELLG